MANITLVKGQVYRIRLTDGRWTDGKFLYEKAAHRRESRVYGTYTGPNRHFMFENVRTGREIEIKSMQKIREIRDELHYTRGIGAGTTHVRVEASPVLDSGVTHAGFHPPGYDPANCEACGASPVLDSLGREVAFTIGDRVEYRGIGAGVVHAIRLDSNHEPVITVRMDESTDGRKDHVERGTLFVAREFELAAV